MSNSLGERFLAELRRISRPMRLVEIVDEDGEALASFFIARLPERVEWLVDRPCSAYGWRLDRGAVREFDDGLPVIGMEPGDRIGLTVRP